MIAITRLRSRGTVEFGGELRGRHLGGSVWRHAGRPAARVLILYADRLIVFRRNGNGLFRVETRSFFVCNTIVGVQSLNCPVGIWARDLTVHTGTR